MNSKVRQELFHLLNRYHEDIARKSILEYELEHLSKVTEGEMIEAMTFHRAEGIAGLSAGQVADKTFYIANNVSERTMKANDEMRNDLSDRLFALIETWERLNHYISVLRSNEQSVIRLHFFEDKEWTDIAAVLETSVVTAKRICSRAIDRLSVMYEETQVSPDLIGDPKADET